MGALRGRLSGERAAFAGIFVVTLLGLLSIGATLPVLPLYVTGPVGAGDISVGIVTGAYAITGLACRPIAGMLADSRGRKPIVIVGAALTALAGALYFVPAGVPGLIVARLVLGAGEGMVYTAGSAWVVDLTPVERRGRVIGLYGLAIWGGLSLGPVIGDSLLRLASFEVVWAFTVAAPLTGALIATRIPPGSSGMAGARRAGAPGTQLETPSRAQAPLPAWRRAIAIEAIRPGLALTLATIGYAAMAAFVVLHLDAREVGHGAAVFTAFAASVVTMRVVGGHLPDRLGASRCAIAAGLVEAVGLLVIAQATTLPEALAGAVVMGAAFSILFPSLALLTLSRVGADRRGSAMGTFTAFFDLGVGIGAPLAGFAVVLGGYPAAFVLAAAAALGTAVASASAGRADERAGGPG